MLFLDCSGTFHYFIRVPLDRIVNTQYSVVLVSQLIWSDEMAIDVFSFLWPVHTPGHKWIEARAFETHDGESRPKDEPEWLLTEDIAIGDAYHAKRYAPLEEAAGLFRTFAALRGDDRDALLSFADRYGLLGITRLHDKAIGAAGSA